jgi:hypothetical protein
MYMFLISQQDLQHCGVIALRERRWSKKAAGLSADDVRDDLEILESSRFVVIDDDAEELLVRSLMRRDKVYAQPNVFKAAAEQIRAVSSLEIRAALLDELRRLPAEELKGDTKSLLVSLVAELERLGTPSPTPPPRGSGTPYSPHSEGSDRGAASATSTGQGSDDVPWPTAPNSARVFAGPKGSRTPSGTPSEQVPSEPRGKGSSYGEQVVVPLSPEPLPVPPSAGAPAPQLRVVDAEWQPTTTDEILAFWLESVHKRPPRQVIGQVGKSVKEMLADGIDPADVRRGLEVWVLKGLHPSTLPSVVNEVMNAPARTVTPIGPARSARSTTDERVAQAQALKARFANNPPTIAGEITR